MKEVMNVWGCFARAGRASGVFLRPSSMRRKKDSKTGEKHEKRCLASSGTL
ncbi:Uncharacterized protein DAT39_019310 [Clarias magur]|uniref:Uncharacterized protein n=1 Tax=Clarias magur TaxID=1594786 RepID=A0A8J4U172_CLAMG|nr:Uncharacterized protein DAT39_019310 [Clarias magur]